MDQLQLFEFEINEEKLDDISFYVLKLPNSVMNLFTQIEKDNKNEYYKSFAKSVGFKLGSLVFEEIIFSNNTISDIKKDEGRWIYSTAAFDLDVYKKLIFDWLTKEVALKNVNYEIQLEEEWSFEEELISLKAIWQHPNENFKYRVLPAYYIHRLSKERFDFSCLDRTLNFHRVIGKAQAQMMTMPIELTKKKYSAFSYGLECRLIQPIDTLKYYLKFHLKCVRFYDETKINKGYINLDSDTRTIYVHQENKYFDKDEIAFHTLKINQYSGKRVNLENTGDQIFAELTNLNILDVLQNPKNYRQIDSPTICLIGFNGNEAALTKTGVGLPERNEMFHLLKEKLPNLEPHELINEIKEKSINKNKVLENDELELYEIEKFLVAKKGKNDDVAKKSKSLNKRSYCIDKKEIKIAIASQSEELKEMIIATMCALLRIPKGDNTNEDGLKLEFIPIDNHFTVHLAEHQTPEAKLLEIEEYFNQINLQCDGCIVDIEDYHEIKGLEQKDTKHIVRVALKNRMIFSQFIHGHKELSLDKVISACKDLLFAIGFREAYLYDETILTQDDILLGLDSIGTNDKEKRFAFSKIVEGKVYYKFYPFSTWEDSNKAILSLNEARVKDTKVNIKNSKQYFSQWMLETLDEVLSECKGNVYFYVNSTLKQQGLLPMLNNKNFINLNLPLANLDKLKIIRINNDRNELPQYFINTEKGEINKNKGIFTSGNQTYYLIGSKSDQDKKGKHNTKCTHPTDPLKRQFILEINIQGTNDKEELDEIAKLTQNLRKLNITYNIEASLPLPMYVIKRISEYMIAIKKMHQ